ncbi:receptor activity-modifying protein 1-like isoform X2 [Eucyclogobius newberryi]|uniref:receptor activity-modifying protein 1-like isoform X2 n=1 Tax=Eucyclogobius newberryi TaxID=166745 RepID=UPI003B5C538E
MTFPLVLLLCICSGAWGSSSRLVVLPCDRSLFESKLELCLSEFNRSLERAQYRRGCVWPVVKGHYNHLKHCVDRWAEASWCRRVGALENHFFMDVHLTYFSECGRIQDPPMTTLVLMVAPLVMSTPLLAMLCVHLATQIQT